MKNAALQIRPRAGIVLAITTAWFLTAGAPVPPTLPELNEKVLTFARAKLGKSVGNGSCNTLAIVALDAAGARSAPSVEPGGDFVWGRRIESFEEALPGDILQFHRAVFRGKRAITNRRWVSWHHEYPHHTAIVGRVSEGGNVVTVLHQNVTRRGKEDNDSRNVQEATLRMDSLQKGGWVRIYRPVAANTPALAPDRAGGTSTPDGNERGEGTGVDPRP